ncbi:MAG TPA: FAD-dependent oxidoreductase [Ilumatobacteraceae bacterium]|jgi:succinate dehydrogenase/fumarate reductase flavoprotein subunit
MAAAVENYDVVVVGSGAGGMTAALAAQVAGLKTILIEKADLFGGTSALSGGGVWVPNAPEFVRRGLRDDPERIYDYLFKIAGQDVAAERLRRYVDEAPKMMELLEAQREAFGETFIWAEGYSDYHPEQGGNADGRGLWPAPIDKRKLGEDGPLIRGGKGRVPGAPEGAWMTAVDVHDLIALRWGGVRGLRVVLRLARRTVVSRIRRTDMATGGQALIGRLLLALRKTGVPLWRNTPMDALVVDGEGKVIGVDVTRDGSPVRLVARGGVILATGGFDFNTEMRHRHHPLIGDGWPVGCPDDTGDGIIAGERLGAAVELMDDAWWMPLMQFPNNVNWVQVLERSYPGQFIVNSAGRRFVNEAAPYTDFVHAQLEGHASGVSHIPVFMIIDERAWKRNIIADHIPGRKMPKGWLESGLVSRADTLEALAAKIGVPPTALVETARRYNAFARAGRDEDFGRGESAYDRYYGDDSYPNPNLAPVDKGPFMAFRIVPGDLGTKGGLLTDVDGRVLRTDGSAIDGLYATGNTSASVMGHDYAGPGATIGPAMTFGYLAANHIAAALEPVR